jgi:AcrR family transcriptional regulator
MLFALAKNGSIVGAPAANRPNASDSSGLDDDRERILTAAAHLFDELGVADTSLERIASQAGLPRSAVLRQFASKLDLVTLYVGRWAAERRAAAEAERAKYDGDPRGVLSACAKIIDAPNDTATRRSWVHFAAELPDGHPVRHIVIELRRWYLDFLARELGQLGHQEPMETAATLLMFHTGAMSAAALEGMGPEVGGQISKLYRDLIDYTM